MVTASKTPMTPAKASSRFAAAASSSEMGSRSGSGAGTGTVSGSDSGSGSGSGGTPSATAVSHAQLQKFLDEQPRGCASKLAKKLGITPGSVSLWKQCARTIPQKHMQGIRAFMDAAPALASRCSAVVAFTWLNSAAWPSTSCTSAAGSGAFIS